MTKTAIILFNLGGPDRLLSVRPFLFNLFSDPAILRLPQPLRYLLAHYISGRRERAAKEIYAKCGGSSPILANTVRQAKALERILGVSTVRCFIAMRYWHPFAKEIIDGIKDFEADQVLLLPLYPQYSTTTTQSSLRSWREAAQKAGLNLPTTTICCYPEQHGFIAAQAAKIRAAYAQAQAHGKPRVLFSAHGLPKKIVRDGDPYPLHCMRTVEALRRTLNIDDLDSVLCYQSRVGPLEWIEPSTDSEIRRAGNDRVPIVVAPIAFVSEHSETLVEIDIEYRALATASGVPYFAYCGAVGDDAVFIEGLADLVREALTCGKNYLSGSGARLCPNGICTCPMERD